MGTEKNVNCSKPDTFYTERFFPMSNKDYLDFRKICNIYAIFYKCKIKKSSQAHGLIFVSWNEFQGITINF